MLPKSKRLKRDDFSKFQKKTTLRGNYFDITASPAQESRFACVVSKKRINLAVDRNKIKRKIYSALSETLLKSPHFVIVYPKQNTKSAPYKEILSEIKKRVSLN